MLDNLQLIPAQRLSRMSKITKMEFIKERLNQPLETRAKRTCTSVSKMSESFGLLGGPCRRRRSRRAENMGPMGPIGLMGPMDCGCGTGKVRGSPKSGHPVSKMSESSDLSDPSDQSVLDRYSGLGSKMSGRVSRMSEPRKSPATAGVPGGYITENKMLLLYVEF